MLLSLRMLYSLPPNLHAFGYSSSVHSWFSSIWGTAPYALLADVWLCANRPAWTANPTPLEVLSTKPLLRIRLKLIRTPPPLRPDDFCGPPLQLQIMIAPVSIPLHGDILSDSPRYDVASLRSAGWWSRCILLLLALIDVKTAIANRRSP